MAAIHTASDPRFVEIVGLAARTYASSHLSAENPYIIQILLILLAPILFAAAIYMFLGRLIRATGQPHLSPIRITWLTKIFVLGDIFCFLVQAAGAAKLVSADTADAISSSQDIVLGGLGLQVVMFGIFAVCSVVFHVRISKPPHRHHVDPAVQVHAMLATVYASGLLVTVRNVYRLVEYKESTTGYLQTHEWPTYGLDVGLMACIMLLTLFWYGPGVGAKAETGTYPLMSRGSTPR
ncbi:RTA1 like protein [Aspergillus violaceofuscus CBS 115571]|uniref:RTA1 like protein n=1 Tax=Aspergillus violaceofuscus (strain CBS 115571) TaxID=1450538 RepID=A0A2V5HC44_ASPV1|nr:RTA1 like protein [Aspergillus violaceofuscus CBS 115571]